VKGGKGEKIRRLLEKKARTNEGDDVELKLSRDVRAERLLHGQTSRRVRWEKSRKQKR